MAFKLFSFLISWFYLFFFSFALCVTFTHWFVDIFPFFLFFFVLTVFCFVYVFGYIDAQQILFHLSQFTPRRHTIRLKDSNRSNKKSNTPLPTQSEYDKLCTDSLNEVLRNFQASTSTNLSILELPLSSIITKDWTTATTKTKSATNSVTKRLNRLHQNIKTNYVSHNTFRENKSEPMQHDLPLMVNSGGGGVNSSPNRFLLVSNLINQLSKSTFRSSTQIRGFKTQRTIESQLKRNPTFISRFQQVIGRLYKINNWPFLWNFRVNTFCVNFFLIAVPLSKNESTALASKQRNETLNKLLTQIDDSTSSTSPVADQKQRVKVAFAEGYLAASSGDDKLGVAAKLVKVYTVYME